MYVLRDLLQVLHLLTSFTASWIPPIVSHIIDCSGDVARTWNHYTCLGTWALYRVRYQVGFAAADPGGGGKGAMVPLSLLKLVIKKMAAIHGVLYFMFLAPSTWPSWIRCCFVYLPLPNDVYLLSLYLAYPIFCAPTYSHCLSTPIPTPLCTYLAYALCTGITNDWNFHCRKCWWWRQEWISQRSRGDEDITKTSKRVTTSGLLHFTRYRYYFYSSTTWHFTQSHWQVFKRGLE